MEWVAFGVVALWLSIVHRRFEKVEKEVDRVERVQGGQLHREAQRDPPYRL